MFHAIWLQPCTTDTNHIRWIYVTYRPAYLIISESVCNAVLSSLVDSVKTIVEMLTRIQDTASDAFDNIFAPTISDLSQDTNLVTKTCTTAYNAEDRPKDQLWCMVLGQYLGKHLIKASHIYKRRWPVSYAVSPSLLLEVEMLCLHSIRCCL